MGGDGVEGRRPLVPVGRMTAIGQDDHVGLTGMLRADGVILKGSAIFVVLALHHGQRAADVAHLRLQVPVPDELRQQPGEIPGEEGAVHVVVVFRQALAQSLGFEGDAGAGDADGRFRLHEDMGREDDDAQRRGRVILAGIDQRDRGTVGMTQQDRPGNTEGLHQVGQRRPRLDMKIVDAPGEFVTGLGLAIAPSAVDADPQAGPLLYGRREIPPQRNGAQPLVQHDDGWRGFRPRAQPLIFKPVPAGGHKGHAWLMFVGSSSAGSASAG